MKIGGVEHIEVYFSAYGNYVVNFVWDSNILVYFEQNIEFFVQVTMKNNWH